MMTSTSLRQIARRPNARLLIAALLTLVFAGREGGRGPVHAVSNPIVVENSKTGTLDNWDISGSGDPSIQGFATDISVNTGETVFFKVKTDAADYRIDIYRLGYYGTAGARKLATVQPSASLPQSQPACDTDPDTGLVDCGKWGLSASWSTAGAVSGIYVAKLTRTGTGGSSHIVFVVRDDARKADVVVQTSDPTWQAYNRYGGGSLYCGGPISNAGSAYVNSCATRSAKVSYNRPFDTRDHDPQSFVFNAEYPMVRWLEANGYDVKYQAGIDTDRRSGDLVGPQKPNAFFSVGHDEYWSAGQRASVENARNAGVNLAFFSGNEMFWKTRYEASIDGAHTAYRTLVSYKETLAGAKIDPALDELGHPVWTGTWRDPRFSPPADGGRPENGVTGTFWTVNSGTTSITVPASMAKLRFWRNTRVADLTGGVATLSGGTLGYEWDEDLDNGARPAGIVHLSSTTVAGVEKIVDYGATVGTGTATHSLTLYRHNSGALVFGAGTVQWSWGLDSTHDREASTPDQAIQQATVNLLADMGIQPASLQAGADPTKPVIASDASKDIFAPTSVIASPAPGSQVESGKRITINGTATENGAGAVASVEVSLDGGATWHVASGTTTWSYDWSPGAVGTATIRSRAVDDSGNLEAAGSGVTVSIVVGACPCPSLWKPSAVPTNPSAADSSAYELGVKFKSDIDGFITGIRFYKGPANSGTHLGNLWTTSGTLLATATFSGESSSGWQQVNFSTPVPIAANTTYVASYHTNVGGYAFDSAYFANAGVDSPPLHALPSNTSGGNGVFTPGGTALPTQTFNANNYWVDVVFAASLSDTTPPTISAITATTVDSSRETIAWSTGEQAATRIDYGSDPAILTAAISNLPPGTTTITNAEFVTQHTVTLTGLRPNTTYYFLITATDRSGNLATVAAPTFTVPGPTLRDTALTDFAAGTHASTYAAQTGDGEVILAPTVGSEFSGPALPAGWIEVTWNNQGSTFFEDGVLVVDGARVATCTTDANGVCGSGETTTETQSAIYRAPHSLEFSANFSGDASQHAGFGQLLASGTEPWAIFSTLTGGQLFTRTNTGNGAKDTGLGIGLLGAFHRYRIDWKAASVDYYVDGALVVSDALTVDGPMRPVAASDFNPLGGTVFVDWIRMSSYAASGTFTSRVFDATTPVDWHSVQWTAPPVTGTSVAISVRTGNTPVPDGSWSAFLPVAAPGPLSLTSRFIQYQAILTSSDPTHTPALEDIIISTGHAPVAVADAATVPENGSHTFPASGPGSLTVNDTDADAADTLRVVAVTTPAHGTTNLAADGAVIYTPATDYNGPDAFTYTVSDGLMTSSATVTITVRFGNNAPVAINDFYSASEDTTLDVLAAAGILANDTDVEHDPLTAVLVTLPVHGTLTLNGTGGFSYRPALNYAGPDTFTYKANDGTLDGNVATVTIQVAQVNDPPITEADSFTAVLNQPLDVAAPGVLRNDHDVEVEDIVPLHAQLVSGATHGHVTLRADGSFSYVPDNDYLGNDSFTYTAVDHFNAVGNVNTVTLTTAIKAVTETIVGGTTVTTGAGVSADDPLQSDVISPVNGTVAIAQGVIAGSQPPTGYTFVNQQVNITVTATDGTEVLASAANPIRLRFTIDKSLIPAGQDYQTFQMFRNGVLIPNCLGETTIPAANFDPCVSNREGGAALNNNARLTILSSHASHWNMGVSHAADAPVAQNDGVYAVDFQAPRGVSAPGVLRNDYGKHSLVAVLSGTPIGGTVDLASSGGFIFSPAAGFCGAASFTYKAVDGTTPSNEGTASLVVDCTPHAGSDATTVFEDSGTSTITVLANDSDPDPLQTLTITSVAQPPHGVAAIAAGGQAVAYAPQPDFFGDDDFTYTVSDGHNGSATASVHITVTPVNDRPTFTAGANVTVLEDAGPQTIAGWATGASAGPANEGAQALSYVVTNSNAALFTPASQPAIAPNGTLTFTSAPDANGSATVTVQIHDDGGTANGGVDTGSPRTFVITVNPVNDAPMAADGALTTNEDTPGSGTLSASDVDNDPLVYSIVANGGQGVAAITNSRTGAFTYMPNLNANGSDTFSFRVNDGTVNSNVATVRVSITPVNDAPTASDGSLSTNEDIAAAGTLSAGDIEGDALTYSIVANGGKGVAAMTNAATGAFTYTPNPDANGTDTFTFKASDATMSSNAATVTVTITPVNDVPSFTKGANVTALEDAGPQTIVGWATGLRAGPSNESGQALSFAVTNSNNALFLPTSQPAIAPNGTLTFTSAPNANGSATVTVKIHDDGGTGNGGVDTSAAQTFVIAVTPVNDNPVANADSVTVTEDSGTTSINVLANDNLGPDTSETLTVTAVTQGAHGSVSSTATGVTYTPAANYNGPDTFTYTISDGNGGTASATVSVTVTPVNDNPVANADSVTVAEDSGTTAINVLANDNLGPDTNETLTVTAVTQGAHGTVAFTATGVTYTPAANYNGPDSFTYAISDGNGGSAGATVNVTVTSVNDAPVAASASVGVATSKAKAVVLTATDVDGDALTYSIASQPAHGTVALSGATATYTPATGYTGADAFTFTAKDPSNAVSSPATISITVANPIVTTSTLTATASAQYSDIATFTVSVTPNSIGAEPPATMVDFKVGTQVVGRKPLILSNGVYTATWSDQLVEPANGAAPVGQMKAGLHVVAATFVDPSAAYALSNPASKSINIAKEDARVALAGPTTLTLSGGTVQLAVSVTEFGDTTLGDIKLANVQFWNRATNVVLGTVNVGADGKATLNWATTPGTYSIGFVVGNYYLRNNAADNVSVTVK